MQLHNFDTAGFLRDYWQKKPLLIRKPWQAWSNPIEPDELAGLACESEVESRLVTYSPDEWELEHGPLRETRFGQLGKKPWTLLVQAVDHHVPAVAALLEAFRFVPNWRIDDVMVSYATEGGGVGPHFDQYDVFLVQGLGQRRWQVGGLCDHATELQPSDDLRLLADFQTTEEWILEPGDILYLPPRVAHNGVALGDDCMTYSIGFRAPSRGELIANWAETLVAELQDDDRYTDPDPAAQENPGEISAKAISRLHEMVTERLGDRDAFARWFGQFSSTPKYPDVDWRPEKAFDPEDVRSCISREAPLLRNPASRFSFILQPGEELLLFVDGHCFGCAEEASSFAERLCAHDRLLIDPAVVASDETMELIVELLNQGSVAFELAS